MTDHDDATATVWRDLVMLALLGFVAMVVMMLAHLNPPAKDDAMQAAGNVVVQIVWPDGMPADVDLWVEAPGDAPVGYARKSGRIFDLLRDDLGMIHDETNSNYEFAVSRGEPAGEYTVNVHLYNGRDVAGPVPVRVVVELHRPDRARYTIARREVELVRHGQELTVVRFALDDHGNLVPGSVHDLPKPLRTAR